MSRHLHLYRVITKTFGFWLRPLGAFMLLQVRQAISATTLGLDHLAMTIGTLPNNDFADTALDNALSEFDQWVAPGQIELIGELQLLLSSLAAEALTAF